MTQTVLILANYFIAFFGSILYNFFLFKRAKDLSDEADQEFDYKKYRAKNWDNWVLTVMCAPVLVWYAPDIVTALNSAFGWSVTFYKFYYLGAGVLVEFLYVGFAILMKWKNGFIPTVHDTKVDVKP